MRALLLLLLGTSVCTMCAGDPPPPHIVHIVVDDLGWGNVGYHVKDTQAIDEMRTPHIDALVAGGVELDRHYAHKICSPSRSALQVGRAPIHVNVVNVPPEVRNPDDPEGGYQGCPVHMTGIAAKLKGAGYATHAVGKWDVGMATEAHHPRARGYDSWLGYWHHANDYWSHDIETCPGEDGARRVKIKDLWRFNNTVDGPAVDLQNGPRCSQDNQRPRGERCVYEEALLTDRALAVIDDAADGDERLFLFWSMHLVHFPLQVPQAYLDRFAFIEHPERRAMAAMVSYADDEIGRVVARLRSNGMWDNTLLVLHADNGGEIMFEGTCAGNNYPLRGGKFSNFEGGIRTNALVSGGAVPAARRGSKETALVAAWDWYATYAAIAGVDASDPAAETAGLPAVDAVNQWPLLSGANATAPRRDLSIGDTSALGYNGDGSTLVGGVLRADGYKLLLGAANKGRLVDQDVVTSPLYPDGTHLAPQTHVRRCGRTAADGCLFNVLHDETESTNLAAANPALFRTLLARVDALQASVWSPDRGAPDPAACAAAEGRYKGYWGPWVADGGV